MIRQHTLEDLHQLRLDLLLLVEVMLDHMFPYRMDNLVDLAVGEDHIHHQHLREELELQDKEILAVAVAAAVILHLLEVVVEEQVPLANQD